MVIYSVIHKRVFTPPRDLTTRITETIDILQTQIWRLQNILGLGFFCKCKCHCWVWRMIDSLYYSSRKIPERCENSFVNYRINYQKLCYSLRRIWTQPLGPFKSFVMNNKTFSTSFCNPQKSFHTNKNKQTNKQTNKTESLKLSWFLFLPRS